MIKEFALDPAVPANSFESCRYFLEKFGVDQGRVISRFPKRWKRLVYDAAGRLYRGKAELSKIEETLRRLPNGVLLPSGRPCVDQEGSWVEWAVLEDERQPFAGIITNSQVEGRARVLNADEVDNHCSRFATSGQEEIVREPGQIVGCVELLLIHAKRVKLIDPHFKANEARWRRGLTMLLDKVPDDTVVEVHRAGDSLRENIRRWFACCRTIVRRNVTIEVYVHEPSLMHNRFILSEFGGAQYGTGLDDSNGRTETATHDLVVYLTEETRLSIWSAFPGSRDSGPPNGDPVRPFLAYS